MAPPNPFRHGQWLPAAIWAYLAFGRGRFWSAKASLPDLPAPSPNPGGGNGQGARPPTPPWPPVAVIVPARDEAALLPSTLPSLLAQDYPGQVHVVLVDDQSSDGTAAVARALAAERAGEGPALTVVTGAPRPAGWAGKPWAMAQGVEVATNADAPEGGAEWLLFTDADISHPPSSLRRLVAAALQSQRECVSLMAYLSASTGWERMLMPAFVYFFAQIYPFRWVNDEHRRTAAGAGGCMLVQAQALRQVGGISAIASATIDDVALARALKRSGFDIWLSLAGSEANDGAPRVESRRNYPRLADVWEMVARSAYTQLHYNPVLLAGTVAALSSVYLAPPLLAVAGLATRRPATAAAGIGAWTAMTATYLPIVRYYRAPLASAPALPFTSLLYMAMTLSSARRHGRGGVAWKGRTTTCGPARGRSKAREQ
jgi:hopene-associated glycosyltransferase HpnB